MGMVTDIQRFSLNDGPGIRTTVFFKGCNAACTWCHNPETLSAAREVLIYKDKCIGCGACVDFSQARMAQGLPPAREAVSPEQAQACFSGALVAVGREMTAEDVLEEVEQDIDYYETSGGGVTLSGGEVMMQSAFAREVLTLCRARGITAAIETNLLYDEKELTALLPLIDLVMADVKLADDAQHRRYIGTGNLQVFRNLRVLADSGVPFILRTPVIPGVNDSEADIEQIARIVAEAGGNLLYYELLNFNPLGDSKYAGLSHENAFSGQRPLTDEAMARLQVAAERAGIPVRVG